MPPRSAAASIRRGGCARWLRPWSPRLRYPIVTPRSARCSGAGAIGGRCAQAGRGAARWVREYLSRAWPSPSPPPLTPPPTGTRPPCADEIEAELAGALGRPRARSHAPNPVGPLSEGFEAKVGRAAPSSTCWTCSRTPAATGLHVGHPLGLHRHRRLRPLQADDRPQRAAHDGLRRLRAAGRAVRGADRPAPPGHHRGQHRHHAPPAAAGWAWATTTAAASPPPTSRFYRWTQWIFLQIFKQLVRPRRRPGPPDRRARGRAGRRHPRAGARHQPVRAGRGPS